MKNKNIIKKNHHFQRIISKKRFQKARSFVIYYVKSDELNFKYGVSVGKKLGNAVIRNKIKRQIRQMVSKRIDSLNNKKLKIVIMARNEFLNRSFEYNEKELEKLLNSIY
ncbi:ribonuclease P [Spiroplasma chinense]|uniref:Ribonuclease P protein component n=1 Tax=Spiroplasma chinense TaxID=216932 RepID=A0A5B9Y6S8_9MOLU|nr:ribonuclease P protein component [Spiroplasma chinense]QEH62419.1 ribonuclease P [Spiroplasma chinense]